jgi:hypothetical protein
MGKVGKATLLKSRKARVGRQVLNIHPHDQLFCSLCGQRLKHASLQNHPDNCPKYDNGGSISSDSPSEGDASEVEDVASRRSESSDGDKKPKAKKKEMKEPKKENKSSDNDNDADSDGESGGGKKPKAKTSLKEKETTNVWTPIYYSGIFVDCSKTKCVTLVILLPSGISNDENENVVATVSEDRKCLILTANWPEPFSNVQGMHEFWDITNFEPDQARNFQRRQISLEIVVDGMKENRRDQLQSTSSIELPFVVQKNVVSAFIVPEENNVNILYVTLMQERNSDFDYAPVVTLKRKSRGGPPRSL